MRKTVGEAPQVSKDIVTSRGREGGLRAQALYSYVIDELWRASNYLIIAVGFRAVSSSPAQKIDEVQCARAS